MVRLGDMDDEAREVFEAKIDAFAATLEPEEQAMLVELLVGDDEVTGFGTGLAWPGVRSLLADAGIGNSATGVHDTLSAGNVATGVHDTLSAGNVASTASGNPEGIFIPGRT